MKVIIRVQKQQQMHVGKATFLILNDPDHISKAAKDMSMPHIMQQIYNLQSEDLSHQIQLIHCSLPWKQLDLDLLSLGVCCEDNEQGRLFKMSYNCHGVLKHLHHAVRTTHVAEREDEMMLNSVHIFIICKH